MKNNYFKVLNKGKEKYFKIFFYVSLVFLLFGLYKADYLNVPIVYDKIYLSASLLLLFIGFVFSGISWASVINRSNQKIKTKDGIIGVGLSVFGKYIPGKLWIILGIAEYLSSKYGYSRKIMGTLSLNAQIISIWSSLMIGAIGLFLLDYSMTFTVAVIVLFVFLSLIIFTSTFHQLFEKLTLKILKRKIEIPRLSFNNVIHVLPWFFLNWGFWIVSFYFLGEALTQSSITFNISYGFALAGSLGILAIIAPGGLGVREGILTGYLTMAGLELADATTIAVASRLWFLVGEVFIFLVGLVLDKLNK